MKLYEIPRNSKILLPIQRRVTDDADGINAVYQEPKDEMCTFLHIDGMYSAITTESGSYVHLRASTEVHLVGDHYELGADV